MLDRERVAPDQVALHLVDVDLDRLVAVGLGVALAPAVHAGVGLHLDEQPVLAPAGMDQERLDGGDLHHLLLPARGQPVAAARGSGPLTAAAAAYSRCSRVE